MTAPCRFAPIDCAGPGSLDLAACGESCRGPVELSPARERGDYVGGKGRKPEPREDKSVLVHVAHSPEPPATVAQQVARLRARSTTKPAAPETAREEETMAQGIKGSTPDSAGECDRCHRHADKRESAKGAKPGLYCPSCATGLRKWARQGVEPPPYGTSRGGARKGTGPKGARKPPSAPATPSAPAKPRTEPIAQQRPAQAQAGAISLTFRITLEPGITAESAAEILRQLPAGAVLV